MQTTKNFKVFWDLENNRPNKDSFTYKEISSAIQVRNLFIRITFTCFVMENQTALLNKPFESGSDRISCSIRLPYDPGHDSDRSHDNITEFNSNYVIRSANSYSLKIIKKLD